jgi:hypothetical protein
VSSLFTALPAGRPFHVPAARSVVNVLGPGPRSLQLTRPRSVPIGSAVIVWSSAWNLWIGR